jgi:hypothetical protein
VGLSNTTIGTYRPQYHPLSAIRYLDVNPLSTRYTLFITLRQKELLAAAALWLLLQPACL